MSDNDEPAAGLTVRTLETPSLGDRSYVVHDGRVAFVVDPQRDIDRVLEVLDADGVRPTHVFETHLHNDYLTGGLALARETGAAYLVNAADEVSFDRIPIADGEVVAVGDRMRVRAIATPGHTFTHLSYARRALQVIVTATAVGLVTGFLGVGGGFLVVPALLMALALPMDHAAGTSLVVIAITSLAALAVRAGSGAHPDWTPVLVLTTASALAAAGGARLSGRVDTPRLQGAFTALALGVAVCTAGQALPALA